jgi:hypothetical protein
LVVGRYQPWLTAADAYVPATRPNLPSAVASEGKEKYRAGTLKITRATLIFDF